MTYLHIEAKSSILKGVQGSVGNRSVKKESVEQTIQSAKCSKVLLQAGKPVLQAAKHRKSLTDYQK